MDQKVSFLSTVFTAEGTIGFQEDYFAFSDEEKTSEFATGSRNDDVNFLEGFPIT
jgi:hypothetical protein